MKTVTEDRIIKEHSHRDDAHAMRPIREQLLPWVALEMAALTQKIVAATTDDDRREIAADMRSMMRLRHRLEQIEQRGAEALRNLEKWSTQHE